MSQRCINQGITLDPGRGSGNYMACLKGTDFIKQFDLARGEKSLFPNLPLPQGNSASADSFKADNERVLRACSRSSATRRELGLAFTRDKEHGTGGRDHAGMSDYTFCLSLHFLSLQPLLCP